MLKRIALCMISFLLLDTSTKAIEQQDLVYRQPKHIKDRILREIEGLKKSLVELNKAYPGISNSDFYLVRKESFWIDQRLAYLTTQFSNHSPSKKFIFDAIPRLNTQYEELIAALEELKNPASKIAEETKKQIEQDLPNIKLQIKEGMKRITRSATFYFTY